MFDLDIEGARKLNRKLNSMRLNESRKAVRPALRSALVVVQEEAQRRAPVLSGLMRKYIKPYIAQSRRFGLNGMVRSGTRKQLRIPADAKYYYPAAIERGTRHIAARPFLRGALAAKKAEALRVLGRGVYDRLRNL